MLEEDDFDSYILNRLSDIIHSLLVTYKEAFLVYFDGLVNHFYALLQETRSISDRQWALCVFDDVIQFTGEHSFRYSQFFLPRMAESLADPSAEVKPSIAGKQEFVIFLFEDSSSLGLWLRSDGNERWTGLCPCLCRGFTSFVCLDRCVWQSRNREQYRDGERSERRDENLQIQSVLPGQSRQGKTVPSEFRRIAGRCLLAASSVALVASRSRRHGRDAACLRISLRSDWIVRENYSPAIWEEDLSWLFRRNNPVIIGQDNANVPNVIKLFADAFARSSIEVHSLVGQRMLLILRHVQVNFNSRHSRIRLAHLDDPIDLSNMSGYSHRRRAPSTRQCLELIDPSARWGLKRDRIDCSSLHVR